MQRLYVLISNKLDPIYGCVQGGHVVAEWLLQHPNQNWNNNYTEFKEPDLDNQVTALAVLNNDKMFKNLKLIS